MLEKEFFRFPHTPHLAWLSGTGLPRGDKVLSPREQAAMLNGTVIVEEKLDGANVGFSLDSHGNIRAQSRGQYLVVPYTGQFSRLNSWLAIHEQALRRWLVDELIIFGEWCAATHSIKYDALPDWFLMFDVYDRRAGRFWSVERRKDLASDAGLCVTPEVARGHMTLRELIDLVTRVRSRFSPGPTEGIVIRRDEGVWSDRRAKLVRPSFLQSIDEHWRRRPLKWNAMRAQH
jgi:ATP-dependent RNA circularization protein (DNA/RNA ligase family)